MRHGYELVVQLRKAGYEVRGLPDRRNYQVRLVRIEGSEYDYDAKNRLGSDVAFEKHS